MRIHKTYKILLAFFCFIFCQLGATNIEVIQYEEHSGNLNIGKSVYLLVDSSNLLSPEKAINSKLYRKSSQKVPTFGFTKSTIWIKFKVKNNTQKDNILLSIDAPLIDNTELFYKKNDSILSTKISQSSSFHERKYKQPSYIYDLNIPYNKSQTYYLKIQSTDQIQIPLKITNSTNLFSTFTTFNFVFGIYVGIMIIMLFYNLFIYFSVKDKNYLYYVIYILSVTLTQTTFQGYTFKYLWPSYPQFEIKSILLMSVLVGVSSIEFLRVFIKTRKHLPKADKIFSASIVLYGIITLLILLGFEQLSWILILSLVSPLSLFMLLISYKIAIQGYRPASFFAISWSIFLIGVFIYAMKDFGILPHNNFTVYTMPAGSAIETILLSLALADKINFYKKEKEVSQQRTLEVLQENEKIIKEQNIVLEQKVKERTTELNQTLSDLKATQAQLVDAEKMSSLGQLTAGIAHEINNPINFVSSNIPPLRQDIEDLNTILSKYEEIEPSSSIDEKLKEVNQLKQELDYDYLKTELKTIVNGIEDGAKRTAQIVSGLKNFSRLDEVDLQKTDINEGITSTLILVKNKLANIKLTKNLGELPAIECYPSKLNQLFMNIMDNAIHAIEAKKTAEENEIIVSTYTENNSVVLSVKDTGIGMSEEVKEKIFEPFFTTKPVGEGTGLGMSIAYSIIKIHNANVQINSTENKGTEIIIKIPFNNG